MRDGMIKFLETPQNVRMFYDLIYVDDISPDMAFTTALHYTVDKDGKPDKLLQK